MDSGNNKNIRQKLWSVIATFAIAIALVLTVDKVKGRDIPINYIVISFIVFLISFALSYYEHKRKGRNERNNK